MKRASVLLIAVLLAGCAGKNTAAAPMPLPSPPDQPQVKAEPINLVRAGYTGRFRVAATVLESGGHGPQLCGAVATSYPPQCGGPDITNWKWDGLTYESALKTKWGTWLLTGTFKDGKLTLTETPKVNDDSFKAKSRLGSNFSTPCKAPDGGWKPVDVAKATMDALNEVNTLVNPAPDFGGLWIDEKPDPNLATPMNDPKRLVLNVSFTKDLARHETEIRKIWGGSLCVSQAKRSAEELSKIQDEVTSGPGVSTAGADAVIGSVWLGVFIAEESRQRQLDAKYGPGVVLLHGFLEPID